MSKTLPDLSVVQKLTALHQSFCIWHMLINMHKANVVSANREKINKKLLLQPGSQAAGRNLGKVTFFLAKSQEGQVMKFEYIVIGEM